MSGFKIDSVLNSTDDFCVTLRRLLVLLELIGISVFLSFVLSRVSSIVAPKSDRKLEGAPVAILSALKAEATAASVMILLVDVSSTLDILPGLFLIIIVVKPFGKTDGDVISALDDEGAIVL